MLMTGAFVQQPVENGRGQGLVAGVVIETIAAGGLETPRYQRLADHLDLIRFVGRE